MTTSSTPDIVPVEQPTSSAKLTITVGPAQFDGAAVGTVPPHRAHHRITTFGIMGCTIAGAGAAVVTLRIAPVGTAAVLTIAELAFSLAAAILIAVYSRTPAQRMSSRRKIPQGQPRPPN